MKSAVVQALVLSTLALSAGLIRIKHQCQQAPASQCFAGASKLGAMKTDNLLCSQPSFLALLTLIAFSIPLCKLLQGSDVHGLQVREWKGSP